MPVSQALLSQWTSWLTQAVFPLWLKEGVLSRERGFAEALSLEKGAALSLPMRTMVQCRQIYSFRIGMENDLCPIDKARDAINGGLTFLLKHCGVSSGAFVHSVYPDGTPADTKMDLYTQAFCLFGLANAHQVLPERRTEIKTRAQTLLDYLRRERKVKVGGYTEIGPSGTLYQSNPHMHLFEAAIAWTSTDSDTMWRDFASELLELCTETFIQKPSGLLCEHFNESWSPLTTQGKFVFEPGHHFEWAWLMGLYQEQIGTDLTPVRQRLYERAQEFVKQSYVIDEVWSNLTPKSSSARFWPQCERIKAASQMARRENAKEGVESLLTYFKTPTNGLWYDIRLENGTFKDQPAKASSLYHIIGAYAEFKKRISDMESRDS